MADSEGEGTLRPVRQEEPWFMQIGSTLFRMLMIYFAINAFKGIMNPSPKTVDPSLPNTPNNQPSVNQKTGSTHSISSGNGRLNLAPIVQPIWSFGTNFTVNMYLSETSKLPKLGEVKPYWVSDLITFGNSSQSCEFNTNLVLSESVQNNGTLYAHLFFIKDQADLNPKSPTYDEYGYFAKTKLLTRYIPLRKLVKKKKLIQFGQSDDDDDEEENDVTSAVDNEDQSGFKLTKLIKKKEGPITSHWHNNFTISFVNHQGPVQLQALPPQVHSNIDGIPGDLDEDGKLLPSNQIYPIVYLNDFWVLQENLYPINSTLKTVPFNLDFSFMTMWKFQLMAATDVQLRNQIEMMGGNVSELDLIKSTLMDTSPWLLGLTMIVSVLHSLFDFLAFKNDIAFWKDKKDVIGISIRTLGMNIVFQVIIFLYLLDNSDSTSWMVLVSNGISLIIELWKVKKALNAKIERSTTGYLPFKIRFDTKQASELEEKTDEYDQMAYTYLSYIAYPLLACYAVYSLYYEDHKGWYSFIINTAVGFVYTFGFITMCPQLFINYKLKSVAHMPWRTFMYKALNTFVDDLFAFIIKMPTLHRLACLRDDVVFFVYLYQRYIYREDPNRPNEFGQVSKEEEVDKLIKSNSEKKVEEVKDIESKKDQ